MSKKILLVSLLAALSLNAQAFELPKLGSSDKGSASSGDIEADVNDFVAKSLALAVTSTRSLVAINSAYKSDEEIAKSKAALAAAEAKTNPGEKQAAIGEVYKTEAADAEKFKNSKDATEKLKSLSADKQKLVGKAVFNLAVAALSAPSLVDKGQKIVSGASLTNVAKIIPVKDSIPLLQRFVSDGASTIAGFAKLAKGANIAIPEATASSQQQDVAIN